MDILERDIPEPQHLLKNFLRAGQFFILSGGSKSNKSWTAMELAIAVSQGDKFMKWQSFLPDGEPNRVYYIDTELEDYDLKKRINMVSSEKGLSVDRGEIQTLSLRGINANLTSVVDKVIDDCKVFKAKLICIDSQYSLLDGEENSNDYIRRATKQVHRLARNTGAAVVATLHHGKGDQSGKRALDRIVGGGAWGRACDVALDIMKHSQPYCYNIEPTMRTFEDVPKFVATRVGNIWEVSKDIKPDAGKSGSDAGLFALLERELHNLGFL